MQTADEKKNTNGKKKISTVFLTFPGTTTVKAWCCFAMSHLQEIKMLN